MTKENPFSVLNRPLESSFSNSSGTEVRCVADGVPNPNLSWRIKEGGNAPDVPGLRYTRPDGTLVFLPFMRNDYRQDVHDTVYQCLASNSIGSVISRGSRQRSFVECRILVTYWKTMNK
ncbi:down syndrome cell adhesion molecule-like protein Dscam2 [Caerostris extrusa]|uniref:Down syndrome cell adhesion molecule-like protein Dscam2 n=1 Tax=Caerostris extrusa TaxID=172846 RepID=A0AAV4Y0L9_CAEEX|nr:down syndrome cell adhesion molecule-like protein Dscam2 [Caerostris extrusa]